MFGERGTKKNTEFWKGRMDKRRAKERNHEIEDFQGSRS